MLQEKDINSRLFEFVEFRYKGNKSALAHDIGVTRQRIQKYYSGSAIPVNIVAKIMDVHPDLSPFWLLHGRGPMLLRPEDQLRMRT